MQRRASGRIKQQGCASYAWRKKPKMQRKSRLQKTSKPPAKALARSCLFLQALLDGKTRQRLFFGGRTDTSQLSCHDFGLPIWIQANAENGVAPATEKLQTRASSSGDFIPRSNCLDENGYVCVASGAFSRHRFLRARRTYETLSHHYHFFETLARIAWRVPERHHPSPRIEASMVRCWLFPKQRSVMVFTA